MEASKVSEDISILNFSPRQLENLVDGLMGIGDKNGDKKITFDVVKDADWVVEAVVERIDIKHNIYEKIFKFRKSGAIVSSNTS